MVKRKVIDEELKRYTNPELSFEDIEDILGPDDVNVLETMEDANARKAIEDFAWDRKAMIESGFEGPIEDLRVEKIITPPDTKVDIWREIEKEAKPYGLTLQEIEKIMPDVYKVLPNMELADRLNEFQDIADYKRLKAAGAKSEGIPEPPPPLPHMLYEDNTSELVATGLTKLEELASEKIDEVEDLGNILEDITTITEYAVPAAVIIALIIAVGYGYTKYSENKNKNNMKQK